MKNNLKTISRFASRKISLLVAMFAMIGLLSALGLSQTPPNITEIFVNSANYSAQTAIFNNSITTSQVVLNKAEDQQSAVMDPAATYKVTNLNDSGLGSLRQAILDANATTANDTIEFNISGCPSGICKITLTSGEFTINETSTAGTLTITNSTGATNLLIDGNKTVSAEQKAAYFS